VRALDTTTNWSPVAAIARGRTCCTFLRMGKPRLAPGEPPSPPLLPAAVHTCAHAIPRRRPTPSANVWYIPRACASSHLSGRRTSHVLCCAVLCCARVPSVRARACLYNGIAALACLSSCSRKSCLHASSDGSK
jgi:hypothetical protein